MDATQGLAPTPTPTPSQQQQQQLRRRDVFVVSFIASLVCMTCAGTLYLFSAYSPDLVSKLRLSQTDINVIASFGGFGLYMSGPVAGWLADRFSVRPLIAASALFLLIGYVGMAAILEFMGSILPPTASLSVCYCLVGLGSSGIFNGVSLY
jgi:MFS family permease